MPQGLAPSAGGLLPQGFPSPSGSQGGKGTISVSGLTRYQAIEELGRGAMGTVYKAKDTVLERMVALKMVSEEVRKYPVALTMFQQEAKALAALNHPNVVMVFDQGKDGDQYYMVMEFVEGRTLESILESKQKLGLGEAMDLVSQLCAGLAYAVAM